MVSGVGQQRVVVDMFGNEDEEGLTDVYKPLRERQRSLPVLTPQEPVNLVKMEVDLESDLDRSVHSVRQTRSPEYRHADGNLSLNSLSHPTGAPRRMFSSWLGY